jgi:hypothetical protein
MLTSPLWIGGEIFLGFSLTIFVGALIAAFGNQIRAGRPKPSAYAASPTRLPNAGAFGLPVRPQLGRSPRIVEPGRLLTVGQKDAAGAFLPLAPRFGRAQGDLRKEPARAVSRRAA